MKKNSLSETTNLVTGLSEVALDSMLEEGVLKDIPILGSAVSIARSAVTIRDRWILTSKE